MKKPVDVRHLRKILVPLARRAKKETYSIYSGNEAVDTLIFSDPFAFLLGVIADQMMASERAWHLPFLLKKRMGHLDPAYITSCGERWLEKIIRTPSSLHRFPRTMARWFIRAATIVVTRYQGKAENIWNRVIRHKKFRNAFMSFPGYPKKSLR